MAVIIEQTLRSGGSTPPPGLVDAVRRVYLEMPYDGPACPSYVHEDAQGRVDAFMGVLVHRLRFGDEVLRIAASGPMVIAPDTTSKAVGVLLDRQLMTAGYDVVLTDGASRDAYNVWTRMGGVSTPLGSMHWQVALRPASAGFDALRQRQRLQRAVPATALALVGGLARPLDAVLRRLLRSAEVTAEDVEAQVLGVDELMMGLDEIGRHYPLRPAYERSTLEWLFKELRAVPTRGELRGHLLRNSKGQVLGWYLYFLKKGGESHVLQIAARPRAVSTVVGHLLADADRGGAVSLWGRAEPELLEALDLFRVRYVYRAPFSLIQTKRPDIIQALYSGRALLTRLEGEWWVGLHQEAYAETAPDVAP